MAELRRLAASLKRGDAVRWADRAVTRLRFESPAGHTRVRSLPRSVLAQEVPSQDVHALHRHALDQVLEALEPLPVVVSPAVPRRPRQILVRDRDLEGARRALVALGLNWSMRRHGQELVLRPRYAHGGVPYPDQDHPELRLIPARLEGGQLVPNVPHTFMRIEAAEWEAIAALTCARRHDAPAPEPSMPIDAVWTWVDGADPAWLGRRDQALAAGVVGPGRHPTAFDAARFEQSDELRYSLRSAHEYAPWLRMLHVVTDGQVPPWLDVGHPRIHLVDHREILDGSRFNSHAIEAGLHRIPGLADHYLYLNDDVFFGRIAFPGDFFAAPGVSRFFPSDLPIDPGSAGPQDLPIMAAAKNGRDLMARRFGIEVATRIRHTVHPQLRDVAQQIEDENPGLVTATRRAPFRSPSDLSVAASLSHWYAWAQGHAVPTEPNYLYLDIDAPGSPQSMDALLSLRRYDTFCLNQESSGPGSERARRALTAFLRNYFPHPAPWERVAAPNEVATS